MKNCFYFYPCTVLSYVVVFVHISQFIINHQEEWIQTRHLTFVARPVGVTYYTPEGKENFDPNFLLCTPKRTPDVIDSPSVREFDEEILSKTRTVQKKNKKKKSKHKFISDTSPTAGVSPSDVMSLSHLVSELNIM